MPGLFKKLLLCTKEQVSRAHNPGNTRPDLREQYSADDPIPEHAMGEMDSKMTPANIFATEAAFRAGWPGAVDALKRLHEEKIFLPNYHYELLHDDIAHTAISLSPNDIERCIRRLWRYDTSFQKIESASGHDSAFRWAAYSCAYLVRDARIATDLLTVFAPLLGTYISQELGKLFVHKTCLTFKALVMEQLWPLIALHPDEPSGFFNWHGCLNKLNDVDRKRILNAAGLAALDHPSVPPEDVMNSFRATRSASTEDMSYLARLSKFYTELGYDHLPPQIASLQRKLRNS